MNGPVICKRIGSWFKFSNANYKTTDAKGYIWFLSNAIIMNENHL